MSALCSIKTTITCLIPTIWLFPNYLRVDAFGLVGWFGFNAPLRHFSVFIVPSLRETERGRKKKRNDGREKISKQRLLAPSASTVGPCPTFIQISRTPRYWMLPALSHRPTAPLGFHWLFHQEHRYGVCIIIGRWCLLIPSIKSHLRCWVHVCISK